MTAVSRGGAERAFMARFRRCVLVPFAALLAGCGDPTGAIPRSAEGIYSLVAVNGAGALPALIAATPEERVEMVSGELIVLLGGRYSEERVTRITSAAGETLIPTRLQGTLHANGSALEVREEGGARHQGFLTAKGPAAEITYTISASGGADLTFTYRQRRRQ